MERPGFVLSYLISAFVVALLLSVGTLLAALRYQDQGLWAVATVLFHSLLIYLGYQLYRTRR